jgi:hypothetical protein
MSTTTDTETSRPAAEPREPVEPRPWQSAEDTKGWRRLPRAPGSGTLPLISVQVDLDAEQSGWLRQEAKRAGVGYAQFVKRLIDQARGAA